jgi:hypothetical protein
MKWPWTVLTLGLLMSCKVNMELLVKPGHVAHMGERKGAYRDLVRMPEGK